MPTIQVNGARLYYEVRGKGPETVLFSHGLLMNRSMFEHQVAALETRYRCVFFDFRGQGWSEVTDGGYDMDTLTGDAIELVRRLDFAPCHFVGLSMGGFVGMRMALNKPEYLRSLTLLDTSAAPERDEAAKRYRMLNFVARWFGLHWVIDQVMPILFGHTFLNDAAKAEERNFWRDRILSNHRIGVTRAVRGVIERDGMIEHLPRIGTKTLILVGEEDVATPPEFSQQIHDGIPNSELVLIPGAGHSSTVEAPEAVSRALLDFLEQA